MGGISPTQTPGKHLGNTLETTLFGVTARAGRGAHLDGMCRGGRLKWSSTTLRKTLPPPTTGLLLNGEQPPVRPPPPSVTACRQNPARHDPRLPSSGTGSGGPRRRVGCETGRLLVLPRPIRTQRPVTCISPPRAPATCFVPRNTL
jgi:hypothetical protein